MLAISGFLFYRGLTVSGVDCTYYNDDVRQQEKIWQKNEIDRYIEILLYLLLFSKHTHIVMPMLIVLLRFIYRDSTVPSRPSLYTFCPFYSPLPSP